MAPGGPVDGTGAQASVSVSVCVSSESPPSQSVSVDDQGDYVNVAASVYHSDSDERAATAWVEAFERSGGKK